MQGVFTALQGIKAENSLVLALFLKFLLLSSSSVTAAHLVRAGNAVSSCTAYCMLCLKGLGNDHFHSVAKGIVHYDGWTSRKVALACIVTLASSR